MTLTAAIGAVLGAGLPSSIPAYAADPAVLAAAADGDSATADGVQKYIITFTEAGLLQYRGGVGGLRATAPNPVAGQRKLDVNSIEAHAYEAYLEAQRGIHLAAIETALGRALEVTHSYSITLNGVAADLSEDEAVQAAAIPGVESVRPAGVEHVDTFRGPTYIGANTIWNGTNTPSHVGTKGKGIVVAILDGGANSTHPSFANTSVDNCGFTTTNPKLIAKDCSTSSGGVCTGPNPEANPTFGHGVHTSSTVAGNTISNADTPSPLLPEGVTSMSGVAPCAAIRQYKVCQTTQCGGADIVAAIQNAIADQVDVLNFSISGGTSPWSDNDRQFLDAVNADVFVAASAGNTSASVTNPVGQVNHRGPWMTTVAASSQDEMVSPALTMVGPGTPPSNLSHIPVNPGSTTPWAAAGRLYSYPIRSYPDNITGCSPTAFPANYFQGSLALIRRGDCTFTEKITNAATAGATAVIIANNQNDSAGMDTTGAPNVPAFKINDLAISNALVDFVGAHLERPSGGVDQIFKDGFDGEAPPITVAIADLDSAEHSLRQGDVLADFSFRGPTPGTLADLTKPDITAPGVDILAAEDKQNGDYGLMSGTSMSGPHIAGSAALLRAAHPDWSVPEVKSALMMTATNATGTREDRTTPWNIDDVGSGRVDLTKAALAGLTMHETYANFLAANPTGGSINVKDLNLAALRNMNCTGSCTWTRTVKNRLSTSGTWSVASTTDSSFSVTASPAQFTIAAGATQTITFTATPNTTISAIAFGNVTLHETSNRAPDQHISVALKGTAGGGSPTIAVTPASLSSTQAVNTTQTKTLTIANTGGGTLSWSVTTARAAGQGGAQVLAPATVGGPLGSAAFQRSRGTSQRPGGSTAELTAVQMSQTANTVIAAANSVACPSGENHLYRRFYFSEHPGAGGSISSVDVGVQETPASQTITVKLYTIPHATTVDTIPLTSLTPIGSGTKAITSANAGTLVNVPVTATVTDMAGNDLVVEVAATTSAFYIGATTAAETHTGFIAAAGCGVTTPTPIHTLGPDFANTNIIMVVNTDGGMTCGAPWLSLSPTSGNVSGGGSMPVTATFNSNGLAVGTYNANACIASNDTAHPLVTVPVTMTVESGGGDPNLVCATPNKVLVETFDGTSINWITGVIDDVGNQIHWNPYNAASSGPSVLAFFWPGAGGGGGASAGGKYSVLQAGNTVGSSNTFINDTGASSTALANWRAGADGYLGFKLSCTGGTCYGYAHLKTTAANGFPATLVDYCYNKQAGSPITIQ